MACSLHSLQSLNHYSSNMTYAKLPYEILSEFKLLQIKPQDCNKKHVMHFLRKKRYFLYRTRSLRFPGMLTRPGPSRPRPGPSKPRPGPSRPRPRPSRPRPGPSRPSPRPKNSGLRNSTNFEGD